MSFLGVSDIGVALIIPGVLELVGEHLEMSEVQVFDGGESVGLKVLFFAY